jgi:hypothetical protein
MAIHNHNGLMFTLKQNLPILKYIKQLMQGPVAEAQLIAEAHARASSLASNYPKRPKKPKQPSSLVRPLVLRACKGDVVEVQLENEFAIARSDCIWSETATTFKQRWCTGGAKCFHVWLPQAKPANTSGTANTKVYSLSRRREFLWESRRHECAWFVWALIVEPETPGGAIQNVAWTVF